ncbi:hypothetical protein [Sphingomonas melonis]|jgi:hypothetical protein|uniref:hypothetical protein n=1 Tax=Sphingomonas melonis TaxID=152682 RepID=UPI003690BD6A
MGVAFPTADILRAARDAYRTPDAPANEFSTIEEYWRNPAPFEAAKVAGQAQVNALFADHEAKCRAEREARWAAEEAAASQGAN